MRKPRLAHVAICLLMVAFTLESASMAFGIHIHIRISPPPLPHIPSPTAAASQLVKDTGHAAAEAGKVAATGAKSATDAAAAGVSGVATAEVTITKGAADVTTQTAKAGQAAAKIVANAGTGAAAAGASLAKEAAGQVTNAVDATAQASKAVAESTGDLARSASKGAATAGTAVADGLKVAAQSTAQEAAHLEVDAAHITLALLQQEKTAATSEVRGALADADNAVSDVRDGRFGRAMTDLSEAATNALAVVSEGKESSTEPTQSLSNAADMEHAQLEAIEALRQGKFGTSAEAMGRTLSSGGEIVSVVDPESGAVLLKAGDALEQEAPFAEKLVADVKDGDIYAAAQDVGDQYTNPIRTALANAKTAADDAKNGRFGEATLEATTAVLLATSQKMPGQDADKALLSGEAALDSFKVALAAGEKGDYGNAAESAGDALSAAGEAVAQTDKADGDELTELGTEVHEYAVHGKAVATTVRAANQQ
jgi:hypothetical protein